MQGSPENPPIVVSQRRGFALAYPVILLAIAGMFAGMVAYIAPYSGKTPHANAAIVTCWDTLVAVTTLLWGAYFLACAISPPKLSLCERGMTFTSLFRARRWEWLQVGAPQLDYRVRWVGHRSLIVFKPQAARARAGYTLDARQWELPREELLELIASARSTWTGDQVAPNK